jgi:hypothetical protein
MKNAVFWDVTPCASCKNRRFGGTHRFHHEGDQIFFSLTFKLHLYISCFLLWRAPSLTRGWDCNLYVQLLLGFASTVTLGPKSRRTSDHNLLSHMGLPNLQNQAPYLYPWGTMWPSYTPGQSVPFPSPPTKRWGYGLASTVMNGVRLVDCPCIQLQYQATVARNFQIQLITNSNAWH